MTRSRVILLLLFFASVNPLAAQTITTEEMSSEVSEAEGELEDDELSVSLEYFKKHKININEATEAELRIFLIISDLQIDQFLRYRSVVGSFLSVYELQAIPSWDVNLIKKILPYISAVIPVSIKTTWKDRIKKGEHSALTRWSQIIQKAEGYMKEDDKGYHGSSDRLLIKYKYRYKNLLQFGVTAEKDAGEKYFNHSTGMDFYSFHFFFRQVGIIKAFAVGDYNINLGQGLTQWNSFAAGKSSSVIQVKRQAETLLPYTSTLEYGFNRGAAVGLQKKKWEATAFFSAVALSARVITDSVTGEKSFASVSVTGLHRTATELDNRSNGKKLSGGVKLQYRSGRLRLSANTIGYRLSAPVDRSDEAYRYFHASGRKNYNYSIDYSYTFRNLHFFGEVATGSQFQPATLMGCMLSVDQNADLAFLVRRLPASYQPVKGMSFTEAAIPSNERGFYLSMQLRPSTAWELSAFADVYAFRFSRYQQNGPAAGKELFIQLGYRPGKRSEVYTRFRYQLKPENGDTDRGIDPLSTGYRKSWRLHYIYKVSPLLVFKGRAELSLYQQTPVRRKDGFLFYLEVVANPLRWFKLDLRLQSFEIADHQARIYAYESDLPFGASSKGYSDSGGRYYLVSSFSIMKRCELSMKWSETIWQNLTVSGTGLDQIGGNRRSELKVQLHYRF